MLTSTGYAVEWVATFLHDFPHIDFKFQQTNSTFDPDSKLYKESIVFLSAIPVAACILVLLLTSICVCVHCCKQKPKKKRSTTCLRLITALFIIFAIGSVAVGFFGNEEGNKGIQTTTEALQDTNDTLSGSLSTLGTLDNLSDMITQAADQTLKNVFNKRLKNATLRHEVLKLADDLNNQSHHVRGDIDSIRKEVQKINLDKIMDITKDAEFYRWLGTVLLFAWQILVLLVYIVGTLKKSKCWLVWGIVLGFLSLLLVWVSAGGYLGGAVAVSDFCVEPDEFVVTKLEAKVSPAILRSYIQCKNKRDPETFSKALDDALSYVNIANNTLNLAINKTLAYNISQYLEQPVRALRADLKYTQGNITSLSDTVFCGHIHSNYIKALTGLCNRSLVGMSLILLVLPILGLSLMFIQCLTPKTWRTLGKKKGYHMVDSTDPFLPRPPPYNDYGTIGEDRAPVQDTSGYIDDTTVMTEPPRPGSTASDTPPPAISFQNWEYYPGSYVEQYNNMGTFPSRQRHT